MLVNKENISVETARDSLGNKINNINTDSMIEWHENQELENILQLPSLSYALNQNNYYKNNDDCDVPSKFTGLIPKRDSNIVFSFTEKLVYDLSTKSVVDFICNSEIKESTFNFKVEFLMKKLTYDPLFVKTFKEQIIFGFNPSSSKIEIDSSLGSAIDYYIPFDLPKVNSKEKLFRVQLKSKKVFVKSLVKNPGILFQYRVSQSQGWYINSNDRLLIGDMIFNSEIDEINCTFTITRLTTKRYVHSSLSQIIQTSDCPYTIGRHRDCNLHIDSRLLSRIHATIMYDNSKNQWLLKDGDINKASINGCFVLTDRQIEVPEGSITLKINSASLHLSFENDTFKDV